MIGVIVGNGLLMSLLHHIPGALRQWNPQAPLSWGLPSFLTPRTQFLDDLPRFRDAIRAARTHDPALNDFEAIREIAPDDVDPSIRMEARHFLVMSFSKLQEYLDNQDLGDWSWLDWFKMIHREIGMIISFNYDLLIELILETTDCSYYRFALEDNEIGYTPVLKPHGSIDFTHRRQIIDLPPISYPIPINTYLLNTTYLEKCQRNQLIRPRYQADVVLPSEYSAMHDFQWVRRGLDYWHYVAPRLSSVVIIGLSYWDSDRAEIDTITSALCPSTRIIMANPNPSDDWCRQLEHRFGHVEKWRSGPILMAGYL